MSFIQVRSFDNYIEANIVLNMLQHYDINCHLKDEYTVTIDPFLSPALGGMKLMVHHSQVERAMELLEAKGDDGPIRTDQEV
jgi:type III secretory pathway lipoprotein EscJ